MYSAPYTLLLLNCLSYLLSKSGDKNNNNDDDKGVSRLKLLLFQLKAALLFLVGFLVCVPGVCPRPRLLLLFPWIFMSRFAWPGLIQLPALHVWVSVQ